MHTDQLPTATELSNTTPPLTDPSSPLVMIADDEPTIRELLEMLLQDEGYNVCSAANGRELVQLAQQRVPDLILVDLNMPYMDGFAAIQHMRADPRTAHVPMLILTAQSQVQEVVAGFKTGADDYIIKPIDIPVLLARITAHLRRSAQRPVRNPLTGLPGNSLILEELRFRLENSTELALLYIDLDNFKVFNDIYGFARGDDAIRLVANLIQHVVIRLGGPEAFIGHVGGDDFVVITSPDLMDDICCQLISHFDSIVPQLYNPDDRDRGYLVGIDRHGVLRRFGLMTMSIGVVNTEGRTFADPTDIIRVAAEMKHFAKTREGSYYAVDQRDMQQPVEVDRRTNAKPKVLIISPDTSLRAVLRATLDDYGYSVEEAVLTNAVNHFAKAGERISVVIIDAQVSAEVELGAVLQSRTHREPPIIMLATTEGALQEEQTPGVAARLQIPLSIADLLEAVARVAGIEPPARTLPGSTTAQAPSCSQTHPS
jgi:PleD family two-component response regulator